MSEPGAMRRDPFQIFLVVACMALCGLVLALALQNRSLKQQIADLDARVAAGGRELPSLKTGESVPPFDLIAPSGEKIRLAFDGNGQKTLLLVFSSTCPACQQTFPVWNRMLSDGVPAGVRVVGVQTDLAGGSPAEIVTFPVYSFDGGRPEAFTKIPYIPCAAVLDAKGTVEYVTYGAPEDGKAAELRRAIGL